MFDRVLVQFTSLIGNTDFVFRVQPSFTSSFITVGLSAGHSKCGENLFSHVCSFLALHLLGRPSFPVGTIILPPEEPPLPFFSSGLLGLLPDLVYLRSLYFIFISEKLFWTSFLGFLFQRCSLVHRLVAHLGDIEGHSWFLCTPVLSTSECVYASLMFISDYDVPSFLKIYSLGFVSVDLLGFMDLYFM